MHLVPEHEDTPAMTAAPRVRSGRRRGLRVTGLVAVSALALEASSSQAITAQPRVLDPKLEAGARATSCNACHVR